MELFLLDAAELSAEDTELLRRRFPKRWERARRMANRIDGRSVLAAGLLLCRVLGVERENSLLYTPEGRPSLAGGPDFSLSHSGGRCVLAVGRGRVGVDLEKLDPGNLIAAEAALRPEELAWIAPAPCERFHVLWTRKESIYKALGGFSDPREIPALDGCLPAGLCVRSTVEDGFALSVCTDGEPVEAGPLAIKRIQ